MSNRTPVTSTIFSPSCAVFTLIVTISPVRMLLSASAFTRISNVYSVFGSNPSNTLLSCHVPSGAMRYSQSSYGVNVIVFVVGVSLVLGDCVGASGVFHTVTTQVAFTSDVLPFAFAVIVAEPAPTAVTLPEAFTVATLLFEELHVTLLSVASSGDTVATRVVSVTGFVPPISKLSVSLFKATPVAATSFGTSGVELPPDERFLSIY